MTDGGMCVDNYKKVQKCYFPFINIAKLYCALLVVMIHSVEIPQGHPIALGIVQCFASQAVPFFMIASGFFVGNKIKAGDNAIKSSLNSIKQWLVLYLIWTLLWLPYLVNIYVKKYPDATIGYRVMAIIRRILFAGQGVYWYLLVMAEAVVILVVCIRFNKMTLYYFIGVLGLIWGLFYDANVMILGFDRLNSIIYALFSWSNNFLMKGIPYIALGYFISKHYREIKNNTWFLMLLYGVTSSLMVFLYCEGQERWLIFYPVQAVILFLLVIQPLKYNISEKVAMNCRDISTSVYFLHTVFIYGVVDTVFGVNCAIFLKFGIAVVGSVSVYLITKKFNLKLLKKMLCIK